MHINCYTVKHYLTSIYGNKLICRIGNGEPEYNASGEDYENADIAIYIHEKYQACIIWNLYNRRKQKRVIKSFSLSKKWDDLIPIKDGLKAIYKKMGTDVEAPYEKVLIVDIETLHTISYDLQSYIKINPLDEECPEELRQSLGLYDVPEIGIRERVSTKRWKRERRFREDVLEAYDGKSAICRCKEKAL